MELLWLLVAITFLTRFYNLSLPEHVCWDEIHFGNMAGHYLNQTYFIDVHPPLGKMLIAIAGLLTGYDGQFPFLHPGDEYNTNEYQVDYYGMRAFCAVLGSLVIPLLHSTVMTLTGCEQAAFLTSALLVFDCGLLTISQYILLDPILLFFMSAAIYFKSKCSIKLHHDMMGVKSPRKDTLSITCCRDMLLCGICLGCTIAVKWTGLFTAAFIVLWTLQDILSLQWKKASISSILTQVLAHTVFLLLVPFSIYLATFVVHYQVLSKSGTGDGFQTSVFQSCLRGNALHNALMPQYVAYDSIISIKFYHPSQPGLLHSNDRPYPIEVLPFSHKQTTVYFHKDASNFWEVIHPTSTEIQDIILGDSPSESSHKGTKIKYLKSGDIIRLRHIRTGCFLNTLERTAILTPNDQIVSCCKNSPPENKLDELWRIEIVDKEGNDSRLECLHTRFRLLHATTGCVLQSTFKVLPDWGNQQFEATCTRDWFASSRAVWNVEQHTHDKLERLPISPCQMSFWERFMESHWTMASLHFHFNKSSYNESSSPWHWPINYKGQYFTNASEDDIRVYLLGNPLVFYFNFWSLVIVFILIVTRRLKFKPNNKNLSKLKNHFSRLFPNYTVPSVSILHFNCCELFYLAWAIHYLPFLILPRLVYFHHYYPAMICNCCLSGCFFNLVFQGASLRLGSSLSSSNLKRMLIRAFAIFLAVSFYLYSPLAYGVTGYLSDHQDAVMHGLKLLSSWSF